jgi:hypothetical protein
MKQQMFVKTKEDKTIRLGYALLPPRAPEGGRPDAKMLGYLAPAALASPARANNHPALLSSVHL